MAVSLFGVGFLGSFRQIYPISQKGKRTKGIKQAHPFDGLSRVNPHAAGVDIGAEEIVVCVAAKQCGASEALTGTWREEHLFVLKQAVALYDFYSEQIRACDEEIERMYSETRPDWDGGELPLLPPRKRNSHSKNKHRESEKIRGHLKRISGVDISLVDGLGVSPRSTLAPGWDWRPSMKSPGTRC